MASARGGCSLECAERLAKPSTLLVRFREDEVRIPYAWRPDEPGFAGRVCEALNDIFPGGLPASSVKVVYRALEHLTAFVDMAEQGGLFGSAEISEAELQKALRQHLRSRECEVLEGAELGGGESDLILDEERILIENKVTGESAGPFSEKRAAPWQARRYAIALCRRVYFVVVGYKPADEAAVSSMARRVRVVEVGEKADVYAAINHRRAVWRTGSIEG